MAPNGQEESSGETNSGTKKPLPQHLVESSILPAYCLAKTRLLLFDYDGTLTPIVNNPADAVISKSLIHSVQSLARTSENVAWVISGRDQQFLMSALGGFTEIGFSAEHGAFIHHPNTSHWVDLASEVDMGWREQTRMIFQACCDEAPGSVIEEKQVALVWHYRNAEAKVGSTQAHKCTKLIKELVVKDWPVDVLNGKCVVEVRPNLVNKGHIVSRILKEHLDLSGEHPEFILCIGDDRTDEDMFAALHEANLTSSKVFCVKVGSQTDKTEASYHVRDPNEVIGIIRTLDEADRNDANKQGGDNNQLESGAGGVHRDGQ